MGDLLDRQARYERCGEFLQIVWALWTGKPIDHERNHYRLDTATLAPRRTTAAVPFGGSLTAKSPT